MKKIFFLFLLISCKPISAQNDFEKHFSTLQLSTLDQQIFTFDAIKKNTASVFIFLLPDCPACESYSRTLNQLQEKFKSSGIQFYGVFPGHYNTLQEMKVYQSRYRINFLLMTDPEKKLVKSLGAKISPEVFVLSNTGKTLYRGRIDDWLYAVGKKKLKVTTHDLKNALTAIVQKRPIAVSETNAIGCIIE